MCLPEADGNQNEKHLRNFDANDVILTSLMTDRNIHILTINLFKTNPEVLKSMNIYYDYFKSSQVLVYSDHL